jgi:hypothetical protein
MFAPRTFSLKAGWELSLIYRFSESDNVQVFAVIMNETAGSSSRTPHAVDYNTSHSLNAVKYENNIVYTNLRRFIVVRAKREFCFAW